MGLHLPGSVDVKISKDGKVITVTRISPEETQTFIIENGRLFDGERNELKTDEYDGGLIESAGVLFDAIFTDLIAGRPLSWIPPGHYYFSDADGATFMVFSTRELLDGYLRYERYDKDPDLCPDHPDYDEMEGFPEVERKEYKFPYSSSGYHNQYDVRKEFECEFF